jgi:hypothetical protein
MLAFAGAIAIASTIAIAEGGLGGNGLPGPAPPPVDVGSGQVTGVLTLEAAVSRPLPGTVVLQTDNGKTFWVHVGSDGSFKFRVPPGTYTATGQSPKYLSSDASAVCRSHSYVVVRAGETTTTTVVCEGF